MLKKTLITITIAALTSIVVLFWVFNNVSLDKLSIGDLKFGADITTITSTDTVKDALLTIVNTNFTNLNTEVGTLPTESILTLESDGDIVATSTTAGYGLAFDYFTATSTSATSTFAGGFTIDTSDFVVDPDAGKVGIGTTSPYAKLSVVGETVSEFFTATSTTATSTFAGDLTLGTGLFWDTSAGALSIGFEQYNMTVAGTVVPTISSVHTSGTSNQTDFAIHRHSDTATRGAVYDCDRTRGTEGSETAVQNGDRLCTFGVLGHDGGDLEFGARMDWVVDGTVSAGNVPTSLRFRNETEGGALLETLYLDSLGTVGIGTTTPAAKFTINGTTGRNLFQVATSTDQAIFVIDDNGNLTVPSTFGGDYTTISGTALNLDIEISQMSASANLIATSSNAIATSTETLLGKKIRNASTLSAVYCKTLGTGTSTIDIKINGSTSVFGGTKLTCGSDGDGTGGTSEVASTTLSQTALSAGDYLELSVTDAEPTGTRPRGFIVTPYWTPND